MDFVTVSTGLILPYWMGLPIRYIQNPERDILLVQDASRATNIATQKFIDTLSL